MKFAFIPDYNIVVSSSSSYALKRHIKKLYSPCKVIFSRTNIFVDALFNFCEF